MISLFAIAIITGSFALGLVMETDDPMNLVFAGILSIVLVANIFGIAGLIKDGPDRTFQATITDFNEVYNNGYEIVDRDGKIYTLRESEVK